jgi:hypothetical protein
LNVAAACIVVNPAIPNLGDTPLLIGGGCINSTGNNLGLENGHRCAPVGFVFTLTLKISGGQNQMLCQNIKPVRCILMLAFQYMDKQGMKSFYGR